VREVYVTNKSARYDATSRLQSRVLQLTKDGRMFQSDRG